MSTIKATRGLLHDKKHVPAGSLLADFDQADAHRLHKLGYVDIIEDEPSKADKARAAKAESGK